MSKRAQRRQTRNEKDQRGCIWGLISIFDLRNGRSTRKLLSEQRPKRQFKGVECSQGKLAPSHSLKCRRSPCQKDGEERTASADTGRTSVRKLMEEEMFNKKGPEGLPSSTENESNVREHSQSGNKINRVDDIDINDLERLNFLMSEESCLQGRDLKRLEKSDLGPGLQELCKILEKTCSSELHSKTKHDLNSDQTPKIDKEKLNALIKLLQDQSLHGTRLKEDGQFPLSGVLVEALHKFGSQRDLFLKLLQDPDSLMVKQIEGLEETIPEKDPSFNSLGDFGSLREKPLHPKTDEVINHNVIPRKFVTRRKSHESLPSLGNENDQSSDEIVILKPGQGPAALRPDSVVSPGSSVESPSQMINEVEGVKSHFSSTETKQKLNRATRKEKQAISAVGVVDNFQMENQKHRDFNQGVGGENIGWCSPNRSHPFTERNAALCIVLTNRESLGKLNQTESLTASSDILKPGAYNLYVEAKMHILEMIESGANDTQKNSGQLPESLGRILSLSDYEFSSSCSPPCKYRNGGSPSDETRQSCSSDSHTDMQSSNQIAEEDNYSQLSPSIQCFTSQSCPSRDISDEEAELPEAREGILSDHDQENSARGTLPSKSDFVISEGMVGIKDITDRKNEIDNESAVNSNQSNSFCSLKDAEAEYGVEGLNNNILTQQLQSCVDSEIFCSTLTSPAHSCAALKVENLEICTGRTERPSPVSVLDPFLAEDDDNGSAKIICQPVDTKIQSRQMDFNETIPSNGQEICIRISSDDTETAFDYVEAILLGSGLNWDEYMLRWLSSDTVLDSTLYDEVELFSSKPRHEQRLFFDCTNEVLRELCKNYSHGLSNTRQNVCAPVPNGMDLILKIWEAVKRHLLQYPQPQSLDQFMKKDMETSKATWMDLRLDIELISLEMEKAIIESLVEDTIGSFICCISESNFVTLSEDFI